MDRRMNSSRETEHITASGSAQRIHFILVGLIGFLIDLGIINLLYNQYFSLSLAHIISFVIVALISCFFSWTWSVKNSFIQSRSRLFARFITVALLILFLRGGILATLIQLLGLSPKTAFLICVMISSILSYIGNVSYIFSQQLSDRFSEKKWHYLAVGAIIYSVLLRFFYLGTPELFYEEAYYWNYAKHLDIGYLDHPPMIGWVIGVFTHLMGDNEFAVRFGAFICWFITAYFSHKLARSIHGRSSQAILLIATLPAFFAVGLVMTPDAPLVACWAAALYYLYQALIYERRVAWIGIGVSIGLGMLSKYTIALLGPATLLFVLADHHSRKWIFRPEPYLAIILAIILFSPVIIWNAGHEWASFLYQSRDRAAEHFEFSLPDFLVSIFLIITPTGFLSVIAILLYRKAVILGNSVASRNAITETANRSQFLLLMLTFLPVAVFLALSLFRETKFHWTVPCWLGIVPYMALIANPNSQFGANKLLEWSRRAWPATIVTCLIFYGAALHYLSLGLPGVPYPKNSFLLGWQSFGHEIEALVEQMERETNDNILVVGMDRNRIASGLAFYRTKASESSNESSNESVDRKPVFQTSSWHLFGKKSLMYEYWFPPKEQNGKTLLLVSKSTDNLTGDHVLSQVRQAEDIKDITFLENGKPAGLYYYRLVKGYRSKQSEGNEPIVTPGD